jgi:ribosomal protein S20
MDKMANKGIVHKNAAGRYKSRLVKRLAKTA